MSPSASTTEVHEAATAITAHSRLVSGESEWTPRLRELQASLLPIEALMRDYLASLKLPENLAGAVRHALLAGGKRLRPALVLASCEAVGGDPAAAHAPAVAVEMIHAFSLVHDDLPALDNDDLRRGMPTVHKAHGEAMAILAGDGLMSLAFQIIAERVPEAMLAGLLVRELAQGTTRMIAGQVLDTLGGYPPELRDELAKLEMVHRNKTGALIRASCRMGALAGVGTRAGDAELAAVSGYADAIGLMFQVVDDLLDVEQSAEHTGKRTRKDEDAGKLTYPRVLGVAESRRHVEQLRELAHDSIRPLGPSAGALADLCEYLARRTK